MRAFVIFYLVLISATCSGQQEDSLRNDKKRFGWAAGELLVVELLPWSYNRFIRKAEFAKVNFKSIGNNLKPSSWEWDDNNFQTNQFDHPYHGSLFYSAFRTNGYNFWQSAPAAFAGSFLWEIAGETHRPAPNDFINTSLGGIALGEMSVRISKHVVNNRATGFKRQIQEVMGLLINPMSGLNRISRGEWGRLYGLPDTTDKLVTFINVGARRFNIRTYDQQTKGHSELYMRLKLNYGDKHKISNIPFNSFLVQIEVGGGDSTYLNTVAVTGALKTWKMQGNHKQEHLYSVTSNYNYIKNGAFQYGGQGFTFKLLSSWNKQRKTKIFTEIGSGITVLAAVPDKYLFYGEGRNYDYGPGIHVMANTVIDFHNRFDIELSYLGSRFKTINGNKSTYILNTLSAELKANVLNGFSIGTGVGQYTLNGFYRDFNNVAEIFPFARFSIGYKL